MAVTYLDNIRLYYKLSFSYAYTKDRIIVVFCINNDNYMDKKGRATLLN